MPLTKAQIIEIQETAKYNYMKRLQEQKDKNNLKSLVEEKIAERTEIKPVVSVSEKKGK